MLGRWPVEVQRAGAEARARAIDLLALLEDTTDSETKTTVTKTNKEPLDPTDTSPRNLAPQTQRLEPNATSPKPCNVHA